MSVKDSYGIAVLRNDKVGELLDTCQRAISREACGSERRKLLAGTGLAV